MRHSAGTVREKEKLKSLHGMKKIQYIWDYYKLHFVVLFIVLYIIGYALYGHFTYKKPLLYTALVNVSASEKLTRKLSSDFLDSVQTDLSGEDFRLYTGLYLTDDADSPYHEYTYASQMKILASINAGQLDVVLMDKEAFDAFSQNGYLCNLEKLLSSSPLHNDLKPYLVTNTAILEDNSIDLALDPSVAYQAVTDEYPMALDLSQQGLIQEAGFTDTVYLGIIENSPRKKMAINYIYYLFSEN